ncbi:hypothetical protein N7456_008430 [Penicillium angulare]|uniref:Clr5 domain-containing protein n=1 Tax=Penicillium angulare TaxID=116970 RepID=A0A9W9K953_9EURO|nr:hypothetical protein N7456_008430 [Penicillium angulare]
MEQYPTPSMTLSPQPQPQSQSQSPSNSTGSSTGLFRPRRSDDWQQYREVIEQLYRSDQLKLRDVKRIMEKQYKFVASEKQYKDRLASWNVRKNIKAAEIQVMLRKKQKRAARGKATAFRRAGQVVDKKRITRFVRRHPGDWATPRDKDAELQSPEPSRSLKEAPAAWPMLYKPSLLMQLATETPSDMSCYTPEPEEEAATPVSPQDIQSPTRETPPYPLNYDPNNIATIPDLVMDDEQYPMSARSHSHSHSHPHPHPNQQPRPVYHPAELSHPIPHPTVLPMLHQPAHSSIHPIHTPVYHPAVTAPPAPAAPPVQTHREDVDAPGEVVPPHEEWGRMDVLDTFQTRLEGLQKTLHQTMSPWARDQDPNNQEINHHEGLGL